MNISVENAYRNCVDCLQKLEQCTETIVADEILTSAANNMKILRNSCALGPQVQIDILHLSDIPTIFNFILFSENIGKYSESTAFLSFQKMCWQFMANLCVQNPTTQSEIWQQFGGQLLSTLAQPSPSKNVQLMILYNIFRGCDLSSTDKEIFGILIRNLAENLQNGESYEFLHIFLEYFLTSSHRISFLYSTLSDQNRLTVLYYLADCLRDNSNFGPIHSSLMSCISKEFKKKSDCILSANKRIAHAREVVGLMEVIALTSGNEIYRDIYANDHSLFLNVGGLLQQLNSVGETSESLFTPMKTLEQVTPNSKIDSSFEKEISFQLKTTLVRILANLSYRNGKNQDYARELGIIGAILDCTNVDGRNPLIKEWSILAVRNLCENCQANQDVIANLSKVSDVQNEVLKELNIDMGSLRIQGNR